MKHLLKENDFFRFNKANGISEANVFDAKE